MKEQKQTENQIKKLQSEGFFLDFNLEKVVLPSSGMRASNSDLIEESKEEISKFLCSDDFKETYVKYEIENLYPELIKTDSFKKLSETNQEIIRKIYTDKTIVDFLKEGERYICYKGSNKENDNLRSIVYSQLLHGQNADPEMSKKVLKFAAFVGLGLVGTMGAPYAALAGGVGYLVSLL